ncbi:uncharacterized protein LACBIDRAFT_334000 [Laccaria bicolor S238N-H82]|uniref:Predicted protein n=1 Tax=Laccaria bicolor (strain S238N-H82 / ATCC MYA-4686) TaxID=486041 RepID=B0DXR9_LACBS|nr:uncharacterized protein LACBIDRAFT_334000 [Laccaria bicolor S238N-H82]EDR00732.1 predicted protein [Laccaria bicolor S238N-H82]|eukprot:XP_001888741.1 predicted protein [Laccaria bicolor S238N-H82]
MTVVTALFSRPTTTDFFAAGDIYATAFVAANGFHYTLSIMQDTQTCTRYHASELAKGHFVFEARDETLVPSLTLCAAVKIGNVQKNSVEQITALLKPIPMTLPDCDLTTDGYFRCRVWLKKAIRVLDKDGVISCSNAEAVVNGELRKYAEENSEAITGGTGGPKVYVSQHSS